MSSNNKKKKKLMPRELAKKQELRQQQEKERKKQRRKDRLYSMAAVAVGCIGSSFLWPRENTTTYIALCVGTGVLWGIAFDIVYARYKRKKGK